MEIEFAGAAREVTGSCHIVRANGKTILLDCGLFQGRRKESEEKNRRLPLPVDEIDDERAPVRVSFSSSMGRRNARRAVGRVAGRQRGPGTAAGVRENLEARGPS